jgi:heterodisulfide reductase subunit C
MEFKRTLKYESDRVPGFGAEVRGVPGCEALDHCIQCGTCSGVCPLSIYMDYTPRQVIELTRSDFKNEVLSSHTIWLCASCYACTAECPKQIRITDIIYELKQRAIQDGRYPKRFSIPVLAQSFSAMAATNGRITESVLVAKLFMKTDWKMMLGSWRMGLGLMRSGRFSLHEETIKGREQLAKMWAAVGAVKMDTAAAETGQPAQNVEDVG